MPLNVHLPTSSRIISFSAPLALVILVSLVVVMVFESPVDPSSDSHVSHMFIIGMELLSVIMWIFSFIGTRKNHPETCTCVYTALLLQNISNQLGISGNEKQKNEDGTILTSDEMVSELKRFQALCYRSGTSDSMNMKGSPSPSLLTSGDIAGSELSSIRSKDNIHPSSCGSPSLRTTRRSSDCALIGDNVESDSTCLLPRVAPKSSISTFMALFKCGSMISTACFVASNAMMVFLSLMIVDSFLLFLDDVTLLKGLGYDPLEYTDLESALIIRNYIDMAPVTVFFGLAVGLFIPALVSILGKVALLQHEEDFGMIKHNNRSLLSDAFYTTNGGPKQGFLKRTRNIRGKSVIIPTISPAFLVISTIFAMLTIIVLLIESEGGFIPMLLAVLAPLFAGSCLSTCLCGLKSVDLESKLFTWVYCISVATFLPSIINAGIRKDDYYFGYTCFLSGGFYFICAILEMVKLLKCHKCQK
ncbi:hypothetical protein ADUPG1_013134 [Aduncisulcus paluster]|uniref:Uncharacterized protein n=1 Tax=Aduncisulcus paluster TaxID=2918883 RepID=A0ABQ5K3V8_9EUKA|nr:hypothetical protein ADUPG1_013134 [Aduncisulcus paluster]